MTTTLNINHPIEAAIERIVLTSRKKAADYAADNDPFSNFKTTSGLLAIDGFGPIEAALFNVAQKLARLQALRKNGRMDAAANEAVIDTYLDLAVYGIITYALARQASEN